MSSPGEEAFGEVEHPLLLLAADALGKFGDITSLQLFRRPGSCFTPIGEVTGEVENDICVSP